VKKKIPHIKKDRKDLPEWDGVLCKHVILTLTFRQYQQILRAAQFQGISCSVFVRKAMWHIMNDDNLIKDEVTND